MSDPPFRLSSPMAKAYDAHLLGWPPYERVSFDMLSGLCRSEPEYIRAPTHAQTHACMVFLWVDVARCVFSPLSSAVTPYFLVLCFFLHRALIML